MSIQSIDDFKGEFERLLDVLVRYIDSDYYGRTRAGKIVTFLDFAPVTFDSPRGDATPFVELRDGRFHYVVSERGHEYERVAGSPDEILALLFETITSCLACNFELRHRVEEQDSRRIVFAKQFELLNLLSPPWADSVREKRRKILEKYPFDDNLLSRITKDIKTTTVTSD